MVKNEILDLTAVDCTADGSAVCRHEGMVVFVPDGLPGEVLRIKILKVKSSCAYGKIEKILTPSPDRIKPLCPIAAKCGGCVFAHLDYKAELAQKSQTVRDAFLRIGGLEPEFSPILYANDTRYRNKAQYPVDFLGNIGFYARHSHRIVPCEDCILQPELFSKGVAALKFWMKEYSVSGYNEESGKGTVRHLYLRIAEKTGEIMATVVVTSKKLPHTDRLAELFKIALGEGFKTLVLNINSKKTNVILSDECKVVYGDGYITDIICGLKIRISPLSFYQVNRTMAEKIYLLAGEYAAPKGKTVLDLYCGAGAIGLSMAKDAKQIIGVEIVPAAIEDAICNASANGIKNAKFICSDAASAAIQLKSENLQPDVVVLDPPRKGCDAELIKTVATGFAPKSVVYVSCDPATLARDCARFAEYEYTVKKATPADLFPRTGHCETVALLVRTVSLK